jgi:hypothetical protein
MEMRAHVLPFPPRSDRAHLTQATRERQSSQMVRDMRDARALFPAVALFSLVPPVSLEPGIGDTLTAYQRCVIPHEPALFMTVRRLPPIPPLYLWGRDGWERATSVRSAACVTCEPCPYLSRLFHQSRPSRLSQGSAIAVEALMNNADWTRPPTGRLGACPTLPS